MIWILYGCVSSVRADEPQDESRLRKVEEKISRKAEKTPEEQAARQKQVEDAKRAKDERAKWEREHPGQKMPDWVGRSNEDWFWSEFGYVALAAPFAIPYFMIGDHLNEQVGYQPYPFATGAGITDPAGRSWMINTSAATQLVSNDILALRTDVDWAFWRRFAFEGAYTKYGERLKTGRDILAFGEGLVTFTFAQSEAWNFRVGFGVQSIDGKNVNTGFKSVYRIRCFLQPFQFKLDLGITTGLGASSLSEIAPGVGFHLGRSEISLGYRRLKIADSRLTGPEFSIHWWF